MPTSITDSPFSWDSLRKGADQNGLAPLPVFRVRELIAAYYIPLRYCTLTSIGTEAFLVDSPPHAKYGRRIKHVVIGWQYIPMHGL